jgi:putative membrane protein
VPWRIGIVIAISILLVLIPFAPFIESYFLLFTFIVLIALGHFIAKIPGLKRLALKGREVDEEVFQRALAEFYGHKISHTKERTGILIYVSLLEHRVMVLADKAINDQVNEGTWDSIVEKFIAQIKQGNFTRGFCQAIAECGEILKEKLPAEGTTPNQLPNQLILKE